MVEENFIIKMVAIMMENGRKIKCMGGGNCFIRGGSLRIKGNGCMISFMAMAKFIMIIPLFWMEASITPISIC